MLDCAERSVRVQAFPEQGDNLIGRIGDPDPRLGCILCGPEKRGQDPSVDCDLRLRPCGYRQETLEIGGFALHNSANSEFVVFIINII